MAEIRIELRDFNNSILGDLDVTSSEDFPLSITYQNFDVRDFNSRNGSFSKTFQIPATRNNNMLFGQIHKDGNIDVKNVRGDIASTIYSDNLPIVSGVLRLTKIVKEKDPLHYDCTFLGDNMDWASKIKNLDLHELRFSKDSYTTYPPTDEGDYVFENIITLSGNARDYTNFSSTQDRLHYPLASYGDGVSSRQQVTEGDFSPAFYLKNIWDKIFAAQGYTVISEFCNSDYFKSLIVPFDFEIKAQQNNFKYGKISKEDGYTQIASYFYGDPPPANHFTFNTTQSVGNVDIDRRFGKVNGGDGDGQFVKYAFSGDAIVDDADVPSSSSTGNVQAGTSGNNTLLVKNLNGVHTLSWDITARFFRTQNNYNGDFKVRGEVWQVEDDDSTDIYLAEIESGDSLSGYTKIWEQEYDEVIDAPYDITRSWNDSINISGNGTAKFLFCIQVDPDYTGTDGQSVEFGFKSGTFEISGSEEITVGTELNDIHFFIPDGKQSDFVSGVAQMFNLQFMTNAANKTVTIEPYDYFYKSVEDSVDWTSKIDYSKKIQDEFIHDIKSELIFKYKDASNDAMLERYNKKSSTHWGAYREVDSNNIFSDGTYKVENKYFSPSFNFMEFDYVDTDVGHDKAQAPTIPMYFGEFSNINFPRFVDRGDKDFGIGARVLITIPIDSGNTEYATYGFPFVSSNAASGYSYNSLGDIAPSNVFNLDFCRANFIHFPQNTVPTSSIPSDLDPTDTDATTLAYNGRVKLSMGTYNGTEIFLDPNLSFNDIYQSDTQLSFLDLFQFRGLYHTFYNRMVRQLKQKPRIKSVYLNLTQTDLALLDMQKLVYLDGLYYRINKIIDFKPHNEDSTKVELVEYFELGRDSNLLGDKFYLSDIQTKF